LLQYHQREKDFHQQRQPQPQRQLHVEQQHENNGGIPITAIF
jgi:hypothetical protein